MEMQKTSASFTFGNVDQLKNEYSKPFQFRGILWRIQFQRTGDSFRVFLHCGKDDNINYWTINASITFRLIPFSFGRYPMPQHFDRSLGAFKFSAKRLNCGISNFITVDDLFDKSNQLVKDDCINFEVEINASDKQIVSIKRPPAELDLPMEVEEKRYSFCVANISEITAMVSAPFYIGDIPWQLVVSKYKTSDNASLGCHLSIDQQQSKLDDKFNCEISVQYELQSQKNVLVYNVFSEFYPLNAMNSYSMPLKHLVTLNDLFDENNGFIYNDSLQLEAHFKLKLNDEIVKKPKRMKISCPVCFDDMSNGIMHSTECGHIYCEKCIVNPVKLTKKCSMCGKMLQTIKIHPIYLP